MGQPRTKEVGEFSIWATIVLLVVLIAVVLGLSKKTIDRNLDRQVQIQKLQLDLLRNTWIENYYEERWKTDKIVSQDMIEQASRLIEYYDSQEIAKLSKQGGR